jgi:hypothetical protein
MHQQLVRRGDGLPENMNRAAWEMNYLGLIDWLHQQLVRGGVISCQRIKVEQSWR